MIPERPSVLSPEAVGSTALLHWREHCIECAVPDCYTSCPLYVRRADGKCARFAYGVVMNPDFAGLFPYGADVRFRRWGKLESQLAVSRVTPGQHRIMDRINQRLIGASTALSPSKRRLNGPLMYLEESVLAVSSAGRRRAYDEFFLECFSPETESFRLVLEVADARGVQLRSSFDIEPGHNVHRLPWRSLNEGRRAPAERLRVMPAGDEERRLIFTWLDLVTFTSKPAVTTAPAKAPAGKVKCLAWDLDNTLWTGTLAEDGPEGCLVQSSVESVIRRLDERGILQTVVSKNDHEQAWALLEQCGLSEYFLYPAINWGRKSESLSHIAAHLNIGIDTFALIDDSPFERAEVAQSLPMVRTYSEDQAEALLSLPEFDVPLTETSRMRRLSYLTEQERERAAATFGDDYESFLRSCEIRMRIFKPKTDASIDRCHELISRSNQLNLSGRKYSKAEFLELLASPVTSSFAIDVSDRFGDYGTVGFGLIDRADGEPCLVDLVLSCRVAQRGIERALVEWLGGQLHECGYSALRASLITTPRNLPLRQVFDQLPFALVSRHGDRSILALDLEADLVRQEVVAVESELAGCL